MEIVLTVLMFGFLIFIHEFGHFIAAKVSGVKVNEFSVGMGPAVWSTEKKGTKYALRILPIGGYVSMEGEDAQSDDENAFSKKPVWQRIIIIIRGLYSLLY